MTGMWIVFAATSFLLIGALMAAWEEFRAGPVTETRARADRRTSALLYFVNQGLLAPLLAIGLAAIGAAVHPSRSAARWTIAEIAVSFVLFEAVTYAVHRLAHRVPLLFRFHRVHHESADLSWLDAFRQHPVEFLLFQGLGNLPAVLLFGPAGHVSLWINVALRLWTAWLHARGPVSLGSLERVLTSPAMHHAHHDKRRPGEAVSQTCNFGGVLSIFDWLFGTERSKVSPAPVT